MFKYWHQSQLIWWCSAGIITGIGQVPLLGWLAVGSVGVFWHWRRQASWPALFVLLVVAGGGWWLGQWRWNVVQPDTSGLPFEEQVTFNGMVTKPPVQLGADQRVYVTSNAWPGLVYVKTGSFPQYAYGDLLNITCTLTKPTAFEDFAFDKYLARYGASSICTRPTITILQHNQGYWPLRLLYDWREAVRHQVHQLWPQPVSGIILGLLIGIQDDLAASVTEQFRIVGVVHILVVSGMHIALICQLVQSVLRRWLSPRWTFIILTIVLIGFCIITGLSASVIRAAVMGLVPLLAQLLQRRSLSHHSLVLIVAGMVWQNPFILLYDLGFQLSFLATIGIIYLQPLCTWFCNWLPERFSLRETAVTTLAATVLTTPLLIYNFGTVSIISPLANLLVVPLSNVILFSSAGVVLLAQIWPWLAQLGAWCVQSLTQLMVLWVEQLSLWPYALANQLSLSLTGLVLCYLIITGYIVWVVRHE